MSTRQLVIIIVSVALLSAGLGVVVTSRVAPREVKVSLDLGDGQALDLGEMAGRLEGARQSANESAAIATLRTIASAQTQAQASAIIDADGDGGGEYAYLAELAGTVPLRGLDGPGPDVAYPALLPSSFGDVSPEGSKERSGYIYRVYLPGATEGGRTPGLPEAAGGGCAAGGPLPAPDNAEILWCAYAWPIDAGTTGTRAFFINHEGDLRETANADRGYDGEIRAPAFDAAQSRESSGDMAAPLAGSGAPANDGRNWSSVMGS